jgi:hypothetical protein
MTIVNAVGDVQTPFAQDGVVLAGCASVEDRASHTRVDSKRCCELVVCMVVFVIYPLED